MFSKKRALLLIVANSVGTGIFTTTGFALRDLQSPWLALMVWCVGAIYSFLGVHSYAALHRKFPGSGGEYHFLTLGIHRYLGIMSGFVSMLAGFTAPLAAAAIGFSVYFLRAVPLPIAPSIIATIVLTAIFLMHYFSLQKGMKWHDQFVFLKLGLFGVLLVAAFFVSEWRIPEFSLNFDALKFSGSFFWIAYAFSGWNAVYYVASELLSDEKTVNSASYQGTLLVSFLYILMNIPLLFGVDWQKLSGTTDVVAVFFEVNTGYSVDRWISALIALGLLSTVSAFLVIAPRVYSRMAEDRVLPSFFLFKPGEHPRRVYLFQYLITLLCIAMASFEFILRYAGFTLTVCSLFSVIALFVHREKSTPLRFYALPMIYVALTAFLIFYGGPWF